MLRGYAYSFRYKVQVHSFNHFLLQEPATSTEPESSESYALPLPLPLLLLFAWGTSSAISSLSSFMSACRSSTDRL